MRILENKQ